MGDKTAIVDRGGRRVRYYERKTSNGPGAQERRRMAALGMRWCRGCKGWLPADQVRSGVCRAHANAEYREQYANGGKVAISSRVRARARAVIPVPSIASEYLMEQFDGRCAYCGDPATTTDHIIPVAKGGQTRPGNIVPACVSCNSSKKDRDLDLWMRDKGLTPLDALRDVILLTEVL